MLPLHATFGQPDLEADIGVTARSAPRNGYECCSSTQPCGLLSPVIWRWTFRPTQDSPVGHLICGASNPRTGTIATTVGGVCYLRTNRIGWLD